MEILDAAAARTRIKDLIPEGASVVTGASETLRLSGIDADINTSGRYQAVKPRIRAMDRVTGADDIRRLTVSPDVAVGSVAAVTETGCGWTAMATCTSSGTPATAGRSRTTPSATTATSAPAAAGSSPSASMRSATTTPHHGGLGAPRSGRRR